MDEKDIKDIDRVKFQAYVRKRTHLVFKLISLRKQETVGLVLDKMITEFLTKNPEYEEWLTDQKK